MKRIAPSQTPEARKAYRLKIMADPILFGLTKQAIGKKAVDFSDAFGIQFAGRRDKFERANMSRAMTESHAKRIRNYPLDVSNAGIDVSRQLGDNCELCVTDSPIQQKKNIHIGFLVCQRLLTYAASKGIGDRFTIGFGGRHLP